MRVCVRMRMRVRKCGELVCERRAAGRCHAWEERKRRAVRGARRRQQFSLLHSRARLREKPVGRNPARFDALQRQASGVF